MRGNLGRTAVAPDRERRRQHFDALDNPNDTERPLVLLLEAAVLLEQTGRRDVVFRSGLTSVLLGMRVLLDSTDTGRLDRRCIDSVLRHYLSVCGFKHDSEVRLTGVASG